MNRSIILAVAIAVAVSLLMLGGLHFASPDTQEALQAKQDKTGDGIGAAKTPVITVYRNENCGCCMKWVAHLERVGFAIRVETVEDLSPIKRQLNVPAALESCHTALIDGYVIEGHVPAADIYRLLDERPAHTGLAVPGMPLGSPGMEQGNRREPYDVLAFHPQQPPVIFAHYAGAP